MSSIVFAILKATVGLLVNKGRDLAAEKLKDGDVADQQFRQVIVRELDNLNSKIDASARMYLLASFSFMREGVEILYKLLDMPELREDGAATAREGTEDEKLAISLPSASGGSKRSVNTSSLDLVEKLKMLKLSENSRKILADARERFKEARIEATKAFSNTALKLSDRILAMKIRIMATLLENVENPSTTALVSCCYCLEELHNTPAVQNCFDVELTKPIKYRFNKTDRRQVIAEVCHMNFVVHNVKKMVGGDWREVFKLPFINIGELKIDPLHDDRLTEALKEFNLEHCCLGWTFGQEGEQNHRLHFPWGIATNAQGQFIVADGKNVKVFDPSGKFLRSLCPLTEDEQKELEFYPRNVATDENDNLYVLASLMKGFLEEWRGVYVFDQHYNLHHKFPLREKVGIRFYTPAVTVSNDGKVFVVVMCDHALQVDVYETDGRFVHSFERGILSSSWGYDITTANDDRVMVLDRDKHCVHVFSTQGDHLHQFTVQGNTVCGAIGFHQSSEHVVVTSRNPDNEDRGQVSVYTSDGEFVRSAQLNTNKVPGLPGLTVTRDGLIAVINLRENKVHIIQY